MFKRVIDIVTNSLIEIGQALLELDGIGFDAMCIGFFVIGLHKIKTRISKITDSNVENID
jgi:hypothetical protein